MLIKEHTRKKKRKRKKVVQQGLLFFFFMTYQLSSPQKPLNVTHTSSPSSPGLFLLFKRTNKQFCVQVVRGEKKENGQMKKKTQRRRDHQLIK